MKTKFTLHGKERMSERVGISMEQLHGLIIKDLTVPLGVEPGSRRVHRLFYSIADRMCFVLVQDEKNGEVITVLPIDYHERVAWKVSIDAQRWAMNLVLLDNDDEENLTDPLYH